jgi:mevalonate kinase
MTAVHLPASGTGAGFGHGKVILLGEHAVVYGHPALAAGISSGIQASARPAAVAGQSRLVVPSWSLDACAGDGSQVGRALAALLGRLGISGGLDFALEADIPAAAGLGSSAAVAVAVARAAAEATGHRGDEQTLLAAVAEAEAVFHGAPSGIDAAAASRGGVGRFSRDEGWRPVRVLQPMTLCVGISGKTRETVTQVAAVSRLREREPLAAKVLGLFAPLVDSGERALALGDIDGLGRLFDIAHGLLASLRVSSPELDALVHLARAAGAIGAKLTGAGGGGAVIALAPGHERDVLSRWREHGFGGFLTELRQDPTASLPAPRASDADGDTDADADGKEARA